MATLTAVEERAFGKRFRSMHESLNKNFRSNATKSKAWRIAQLKAFRRMVSENLDALAGAIEEDLGRPPTEAMAEVAILIREASGVEGGLVARFGTCSVTSCARIFSLPGSPVVRIQADARLAMSPVPLASQ